MTCYEKAGNFEVVVAGTRISVHGVEQSIYLERLALYADHSVLYLAT
jgi:hypothetical protein